MQWVEGLIPRPWYIVSRIERHSRDLKAQIPIVILNQPFYSLEEQVQWCWLETCREDHFVIIFRGLHIEMCYLETIEEQLQDSRWIEATALAIVTPPDTAEHDDVIKWKHFPCNWPFVRRIHRSPLNSPHKGQ